MKFEGSRLNRVFQKLRASIREGVDMFVSGRKSSGARRAKTSHGARGTHGAKGVRRARKVSKREGRVRSKRAA